MHEYAVTQEIIKMVEDAAKNAGAKKVIKINLVIGDLSTFIDDSVQMYFDIISKGTVTEGAKLFFERIPAEFKCKNCNNIFVKPKKGFDCPKCGETGSSTEVGREFYIKSIETD